MADSADEAQRQQEVLHAARLKETLRRGELHRARLDQLAGACLNCYEPLEQGRYCDKDCEEDHQKRLRARR